MIAGNIDEDDDLPVRLVPRLGEELNAHAAHPVIAGLEVVNPQKEPDPARELIPDRTRLPVTVRLSEQQRAGRAGRPNDHPPLGPSVVGQGRRVFDELEAEDVHEEPDGTVVIVDDQRELLKMHAG